jgi:kumamolisin
MPSLVVASRNPLLTIDLIIDQAVQSGLIVDHFADGLPILHLTAQTQEELTTFIANFATDEIAFLRDHFQPNPNNPRFISKVKLSNQLSINRDLEIHNPTFPHYTANQIAKIYEFPKTKSKTHHKIAILTFSGGLITDSQGQYSDVNAYWTLIGIKPEDFPTVNVVSVLGATTSPQIDPFNGNIENALNVEIVGACCPRSTTQITLYVAPNTGLGFFTAFMTAISNPGFKPDVILCTWGASETTNTSGFLSIMDTVFAFAQSQGINISCASGNGGSSNGMSDGFANLDFPASSPHVTSCGGTSLICPDLRYNSHTQETAWTGSGGGLSSVFDQPEYQSKLTQFANSRTVPDVSLIADPMTPVSMIYNHLVVRVGGTSVSASFFAAYISLLKLKEFINPKLYKIAKHHSSAFHDIIIGNNGLYQTQKGYDLVTGLGSIDGDHLAKHI